MYEKISLMDRYRLDALLTGLKQVNRKVGHRQISPAFTRLLSKAMHGTLSCN